MSPLTQGLNYRSACDTAKETNKKDTTMTNIKMCSAFPKLTVTYFSGTNFFIFLLFVLVSRQTTYSTLYSYVNLASRDMR